MKDIIEISVIIPFYYGNSYMTRLIGSVKRCEEFCKGKVKFEILIVNDSPDEKIHIPHEFEGMNIRIINNEQNVGIQRTRINGLKYASGEWILFLDQDDELIDSGFLRQISLADKNDVIVGNGLYQYGECEREIFGSYKEMKYLMQLSRFIQIRNLIPSPGECLLKKNIIPKKWIETPLTNNGADDWLLWILVLKSGARIGCNPELVYIHNDTNGKNLSSDLNRMNESVREMYELLVDNNCLSKNEENELNNAIVFKYLQDTKKLGAWDLWKYRRTIINNICCKLYSYLLCMHKWRKIVN